MMFWTVKEEISLFTPPLQSTFKKSSKTTNGMFYNTAKYLQDPDFPDPLAEEMNGDDDDDCHAVIVVNDNERQIQQGG